MGLDDRDGAYRSRGQSPRRRSYDDDSAAPRSQYGSSRDARDMSNPRSRPPRRDYEDGDYANATRDPRCAARGGSSNRYDRDDYDRRGPNANSSPGGRRRYDERGDDSDPYNRPSRASRYDQGSPSRGERRGDGGYDRAGRSSRYDPNGSSARGGRPPARDDGWGDARSSRGGGRGPSAADSNGRARRPGPPPGRGGGLWGDEPAGGMAGQSARARYMQNQAAEDDEDEGSPAAGFVKGLGAIILAAILGAGAAYGYSIVSAPRLNVPASQQVTPTPPASATPSVTPSASPTKSALIQPSSPAPFTLVYSLDS